MKLYIRLPIFVWFMIAALLFAEKLYADKVKVEGTKPPVGFAYLLSGSWQQDASLIDRVDAQLFLPFEMKLRGQLVDKRPSLPWEYPDEGQTDWGAGLYHQATGSRLLYGKLQRSGLAARTSNVWAHSAPYLESHKTASADLRTTTLISGQYMTYLSLASPTIGIFSASVSSFFDDKGTPDWTADINLLLPFKSRLNIEAFFSDKTLAKQKSSTWFSTSPHLPERELRMFGVSLVFINQYISFAGDFAHSEVFAFGEDIYANAALRIGTSPWRLSLSADGSGSRYTGNDGKICGEGFRSALKFEWKGKRSSNLKLATTLHAAGWGKVFDRSSSDAVYKFPTIKNFPVVPSRLSIGVDHSAENREEISDTINAKFSFNIGLVRPALGIKWVQSSAAAEGDTILPYPDLTADQTFESLKFTCDLACSIFLVDVKGGIAYTVSNGNPPVVGFSLSAGIHGKYGRFNVKLADSGKPDTLTWTISWRLQGKIN